MQQNDDVVLVCEIYDNGIPVDLSNYTVIANFTTANDAFINIAGSKITKNNNKTMIVCEKYFSQSVGNATGQITLVDATSKQASTFPFKIKVNKGVIQNSSSCSNASTILKEVIDANAKAVRVVSNIKELEALYPAIPDLTATVKANKESVAEHNNTLNDHEASINSLISEKATTVQLKSEEEQQGVQVVQK